MTLGGRLRTVGALVAIAIIVVSYLLGAVPFGLILARRFAGIDVRAQGSGNIGATNVARTSGKKLGVLTLILDATKGALPVLTAAWLGQPIAVVAGAGLAAVIGHVFPIYLKLRGGKGVATAAGMFLALAPLPTLAAVAVFGLLFLAFRVVSVGSLAGAITLLAAIAVLDPRREVLVVAAIVVALVFVRHAGNIQRLLNRSEQGL